MTPLTWTSDKSPNLMYCEISTRKAVVQSWREMSLVYNSAKHRTVLEGSFYAALVSNDARGDGYLTYQINSRYQQLQNRQQIFRSCVVVLARYDRKGYSA